MLFSGGTWRTVEPSTDRARAIAKILFNYPPKLVEQNLHKVRTSLLDL